MRIHSIGFGIWVGTLLLLSAGMYGQNSVQVTGVVRSPFDGGPVVNAVVTATSLTTSVETDSTGSFTLELPAAERSVRAWAEGFYPDEQRVDGATTLLFVLIPQSKINYQPGQLAKATNVYSLKRSDLSEGALWVGQSIQNRIPGLQVVNQSGMPGEGYTIQARGIKSFAGTNAPLVVVDGMPFFPDYSASKVIGGYSSDVLKLFSSSDVKRISFLQGAEASVYGSLGAGGVLLIETDDAADLETRVEYSARFGLALRSKGLPVLNRADYREFIGRTALTRYDDMAEVLQEFPFLKDDPNYYYNFLYNNATDWQKEISRPASIMDNNVRIKGGDAIAKYNLAFGFLDERGVVDNTSLTRYTMKLNGNINVSQHLELYAHTALAYYNNKLQEQGLNRETNPLLAALFKSPLLHPNQKDFNNNVLPALAPIRDASGNISVNNAVSNPVALVEKTAPTTQW
jgi:outer membrane receptor protein involved in Fe transport